MSIDHVQCYVRLEVGGTVDRHDRIGGLDIDAAAVRPGYDERLERARILNGAFAVSRAGAFGARRTESASAPQSSWAAAMRSL